MSVEEVVREHPQFSLAVAGVFVFLLIVYKLWRWRYVQVEDQHVLLVQTLGRKYSLPPGNYYLPYWSRSKAFRIVLKEFQSQWQSINDTLAVIVKIAVRVKPENIHCFCSLDTDLNLYLKRQCEAVYENTVYPFLTKAPEDDLTRNSASITRNLKYLLSEELAPNISCIGIEYKCKPFDQGLKPEVALESELANLEKSIVGFKNTINKYDQRYRELATSLSGKYKQLEDLHKRHQAKETKKRAIPIKVKRLSSDFIHLQKLNCEFL
jgi:hypothetical protein